MIDGTADVEGPVKPMKFIHSNQMLLLSLDMNHQISEKTTEDNFHISISTMSSTDKQKFRSLPPPSFVNSYVLFPVRL